jgi:beta-phosphoglucomutase
VPLAAVVFDFDGVLADSEPLHLRAFQAALEPHGRHLDKQTYFDRYLGFDDVGAFRAIASDQHWSISDAELSALVSTKNHHFSTLTAAGEALFPGAAECVRRIAAEVPIAIASGALGSEIEALLDATGLRPLFRTIGAAGDTSQSKPAPDPYLEAVARLRPLVTEPKGRFVAIEDSYWGITSAKSAGLRCLGVAQTYPASALTAADAVVASIADIDLALLRRLAV